MLQGFWNYTEPVTFTGITYEVSKNEENSFYWQNMHAGKRRQALVVTTVSTKDRPTVETFMIDNEHGDGYYKIFSGKGSPGFGHKSVDQPLNIQDIPDGEIITKYDMAAIKKENDEHDAYIETIDPAMAKRLKSLREGARNIRQYGIGKDGKPKTS